VTDPMCSVYESLGADVGIRKAVDEFYDRVVADPRLVGYFSGVDMTALRRHQVGMLSAATGGPRRYTGKDMAAAHAGLRINGEAFDRVVGHLTATLTALGVPDGTITGVLAALGPLRPAIVTA